MKDIFLNSASTDLRVPLNRQEEIRHALEKKFSDFVFSWEVNEGREFVLKGDFLGPELPREIEEFVREVLRS